jgi:hypothetical protein
MPIATKSWQAALRTVLAAAMLGVAIVGAAAKVETDVVRHYWFDPASGFALSGYDPVAYFVEGGPRLGRPGLEYRWGGVAWRFANEGNRAAFIADPLVYAPRFGGYDALGLARGRVAEANPLQWLVYENRLYVFASPTTRQIFADAPAQMRAAAEKVWAELGSNLHM